MPGRSPDEHMLALRQVDQLRTDVANLESWSGILDAADQSATDRAGSVARGNADRAHRRGGGDRGDRGVLAALCMRLDLTDEETFALLNLLVDRPEPPPRGKDGGRGARNRNTALG